MTKDDFNMLDVQDQVKVFNKILKDSSIRKVCNDIGIGKTTIRDRFKKHGYIYNSADNQYIYDHKIISNNNITLSKEIKRNNNITFDKEIKGNINNDLVLKNKKDNYFKSNIEKMYKEVMEVIEIKDDLKELLKKEKVRNNIIDIQNLQIKKFEGDLKVKSIKIYDEVLNAFDKFMINHRELKQQDVISQALWEFLNRYK